MRLSRQILLWLAGVLLAGGCGLSERAAEDGDDTLPFSSRSLTEVILDTSLGVSERRYQTGLVPAGFDIRAIDEGERSSHRIEEAAKLSDCFVARPLMDWTKFGPQGTGALNVDLVAAVQHSRENGVECVVIEIDPVPDRRHVGLLPPELEGMNFADAVVRDPIQRMALQVATQLRPTFLSIGVEINGYYESNPDDFLNYVDLHKKTYDAVKAEAPEVRFFAAFNLEALQGFFGDLDEFSNHGPQWFLIDMFEPKLDAVAFSTLPFGFFIRAVQIPDDYLSRIELHTSRDILFTEIGWPGGSAEFIFTTQSQVEYLARMVQLIDAMPQVRLVTWTTLFDVDRDTPTLVSESFKSLGLIDDRDNPKPALELWREVHNLPHR
jgi:hypothetical protein